MPITENKFIVSSFFMGYYCTEVLLQAVPLYSLSFPLTNRIILCSYGPFPMMYWPWEQIGSNLQLCLAGLRDVDRFVSLWNLVHTSASRTRNDRNYVVKVWATRSQTLCRHLSLDNVSP